MKKFFCVAEHYFSIDSGQNDFWSLLKNYAPFEKEQDNAECLFSLSVVDELELPQTSLYYSTEPDCDEARIELFRCSGAWVVKTAPNGKMDTVATILCNEDFSSAQLQVNDSRFIRFAIDNACMLLFAFCSASYKTLEMHASVVRHKGRAYLFLAPSGTGKSTHSQMWLNSIEAVDLMNDDNPIVRIIDGVATCFGSPWSGKTPCYRNVSAPVGAFVKISRAEENRAEKIGILDSYALLTTSSSGLRAVPSMADGLHESFDFLIQNVPCFTMHCLPNKEAALVCCSAVENDICLVNSCEKVLPNDILLPEVERLLAEGYEVDIMTKGCSMLPFIVGDRDSVTLKKMDSVEIGDIVLAHLKNTYVLHRVFSIDGPDVTLMGDGNLKGKEYCKISDICGTVKMIIKPGKEVVPSKGKLWRLLLPLRRYILFIYRRIAL